MGHAGAIISGGEDTAEGKFAAMEAAGIMTTRDPSKLAATLQKAMKR
jgi:succinyl-CoA synthetase alpha subunit